MVDGDPPSPSSRGPGHRPFTAVTRVRISVGTPSNLPDFFQFCFSSAFVAPLLPPTGPLRALQPAPQGVLADWLPVTLVKHPRSSKVPDRLQSGSEARRHRDPSCLAP